VTVMASIHLAFDDYDLEGFTGVAATFGRDKYAYVVTPNADHIIRYHDDLAFRELYASAAFVLLDSRFLAHVFRFTKRLSTKVCAGSDLTSTLFNQVIAAQDTLVLVGASDAQAQELREKFGLRRLHHYNPPMGFVRDPQEVEKCLQFIENHSPFRFCLIAVGSPQQEVLAKKLKERGTARGLALCIGASVDFITGKERRAPPWMQRLGCEWMYRLMQDPRRLAKRYLVRGPRIFALLRNLTLSVRPR
jgi:exopolysaccharide biosynthesis WecB/TagA/CpsF family protein